MHGLDRPTVIAALVSLETQRRYVPGKIVTLHLQAGRFAAEWRYALTFN